MTDTSSIEKVQQDFSNDSEIVLVDVASSEVTRVVVDLALKEEIEPKTVEVLKPRRKAAKGVIKSAERNSEADIVGLYLDDIGPHPLLTKEDEVRLAKQIEAGRDAINKLNDKDVVIRPAERRWLKNAVKLGEQSKQEFIESNLKLVANVAKWYPSERVSYLDRVQDGNLGLMHAVDKFDWRKGFKFSTYATWWIRQAVIRGIAETGRTIRLPIGQSEALAAVYKAKKELSRTHGRPPTAQEIADFTYKPLDEVIEILKFETDAVSLDRELSADSGTELVEVVSDRNAQLPEDSALDFVAKNDAQGILSALSQVERRVVELVEGFDGYGERNKPEVAQILGIHKNRVTDIYNEAMAKLRHPSSSIAIDHQTDIKDTIWRRKAMCLGAQTDKFFPGRGQDSQYAKNVCDSCNVSDSCLETALNTNVKFGIWGGKSERERRAIRRVREK